MASLCYLADALDTCPALYDVLRIHRHVNLGTGEEKFKLIDIDSHGMPPFVQKHPARWQPPLGRCSAHWNRVLVYQPFHDGICHPPYCWPLDSHFTPNCESSRKLTRALRSLHVSLHYSPWELSTSYSIRIYIPHSVSMFQAYCYIFVTNSLIVIAETVPWVISLSYYCLK